MKVRGVDTLNTLSCENTDSYFIHIKIDDSISLQNPFGSGILLQHIWITRLILNNVDIIERLLI